MDVKQEAGAAGVDEPDAGPVTLQDVLAAQRALERAQDTETERRKRRDRLMRLALRQGAATQAELARKTGLSDMQVSRIAAGRNSGRTDPPPK